MPAKVVSLRLPEELLDWATAYALERGVSRTDLLVQGLESFRADCARGVPEIRRAVDRQTRRSPGVGDCPKSEGGHVWGPAQADRERMCVHGCGTRGREFLQASSVERVELFQRLATPASVKSWGKAAGEGAS